MLIVVQIPMADARPFVDATERLARPAWPLAQPGREFVRATGIVCQRWLGGVEPWVGEEVFADASRAVRFPSRRTQPIGLTGLATIQPVSRRLLCDGRAVTRFELGLGGAVRHMEARADWLRLIDAAAGTEVRVAGEAAVRTRRLLDADLALAAHLLRATSRALDVPAWLLSPGDPAIVIDATGDVAPPFPRQARTVPCDVANVRLAWCPMIWNGRPVSVWLLRADRLVLQLHNLRRLRIHLLRLHAERECLKQVLRLVVQRRIEAPARTPASDALQEYVNAAISLLDRTHVDGIDQQPMLATAYGADALVSQGSRATLLAQLKDIRGNILRKLEQAIERPTASAASQTYIYLRDSQLNLEDNRMTRDEHISVGSISNSQVGAIGHHATIVDSVNRIEASSVDASLRAQLTQLLDQVVLVSQALPPGEGEQVLEDASAFVKEATRDKPRRALIRSYADTLISAGQKALAVGAPLAEIVTLIVDVIK